MYTGDGRHSSPLFFEEGDEEGGGGECEEAARRIADKDVCVGVGVDDKEEEERGMVRERGEGSAVSGGIMSMVVSSMVLGR